MYVRANTSTGLVWVIVVVLILLALLWWFTAGGKHLGGIRIGDNAQTAVSGGEYEGSTPPGTMYPDANDPAPMVGETERNGRLGGGEFGNSAVGRPTIAAGYINRDWSRPVREVGVVYNRSGDFDPIEMWNRSTDAVRVVDDARFVFGIYPGGASVDGLVLKADDIDNHSPEGIGTVTFLESSHLWPNEEDGWFSEWQVNLPGSGRYCLALCISTGFGLPIPQETRWLIEVR